MNVDLLEPQAPARLNVLVIAYYFPPMGLSGVQRTLKFVKYLPEFGWRPIVVTAGKTPYYAHDESLEQELSGLVESGAVRIERTATSGIPGGGKQRAMKLPSAAMQRLRSKLIQTVYQPDSRIRWRKPALALAEKIIQTERIDAIFSTAPPYTDFLVAKELSRKYNIPYMMDYRDAWVSNPVLNFYATPLHKAYARKLEYECLRASSAITVVNRRMKEVLLEHYDFLTHNDIAIIPHGYDTEDFLAAVPLASELVDPTRFRLTYSGAFYVGRSPQPILSAAKLAVQKRPELKAHLELVFAGVLQDEFRKAADKLGLTPNVTALGYQPHLQSVATLLASDVLWMTMSDDISAPGKLYEYIGTRKPILGLVPKGSQAEKMLSEYGAGVTAPPKDVNAIADRILMLYDQWRSRSLPRLVNETFVKQYDRKLLSKELARHLGLMLRT
jgi:glycosyltransferase involved in cell wall biosynthesis